MLVIFRGMPGTGKSFLVRRLAVRDPGWLILSRDVIRAGIIPRPDFGPEEKNLVDDLILSMTGFLLDRGRGVVIDGMALSSARRVEMLVQAAATRSIQYRIIECVCSESTALARIEKDLGIHPAGDRGRANYLEVKARFDRIEHPFLRVDTEGDAEENLRLILGFIRGGSPGTPAV
jgi:predicted kinase